ncbi:hypothetical protein D3C78_561270 [compost metagenome]
MAAPFLNHIIGPVATQHGNVIARTTIETITAKTGYQDIVASLTIERVPLCRVTANQQVISPFTVEHVAAALAAQQVVILGIGSIQLIITAAGIPLRSTDSQCSAVDSA